MSVFSFSLRVRYCDTDHMGVVYHAKYLDYLEWARTEFIRASGQSYASIEADGFLFPCIDLKIKYKKAARYDEELRVELKLRREKARFIFDYSILSMANEIIALAESTHVVCTSKMKICKAPDSITRLVDIE